MPSTYYNAPYLDPAEHSVLNHTGIPGVGGGGGSDILYAALGISAGGASGNVGYRFSLPIIDAPTGLNTTPNNAVLTFPVILGENGNLIPGVLGPAYTSGTLTLDTLFVLIVGDATNYLEAQVITPQVVPSDGIYQPSSDTDWSIQNQVGTDLSIDSSGEIVTAAGGYFTVEFIVVFAPPYPTA
jgi:hypothetical protein